VRASGHAPIKKAHEVRASGHAPIKNARRNPRRLTPAAKRSQQCPPRFGEGQGRGTGQHDVTRYRFEQVDLANHEADACP